MEPAAAAESKRRFGFGCLDWTERRPHLGGALGARIWARALDQGWAVRIEGVRAVRLTAVGRERLGVLGALPERLDVQPSVGSTQ